MRTHTITRSDGPTLHAVETGARDAQPILLVHGLSLNHHCWRPQFDGGLADDYRLVAMDLRGHGRSAVPAGPYDDGTAWADDVAAVIEALDLESVVLVGWSYGSLVAFDYLAVHGTDRVAGVAAVGVVVGIGTERTNDWLQPTYLELFPEFVSTDAATSVATLRRFVDCCFDTELSPADKYLLLGCSAAVPPFVRDGMRDRTVAHDDLLATLSVPALFVHGARDAVVSPDAARTAAEWVPDATLGVFEECGHAPFWESPDRFDAQLRRFVEATTPTG
jgi:pimeloyl-ACP methyl ester carboxylesterase